MYICRAKHDTLANLFLPRFNLPCRQRSVTRESEKAQAEGFWRRLMALRQKRRKGTPGAATTLNNLGVLLVEQGDRDSGQAADGRKLLQVLHAARQTTSWWWINVWASCNSFQIASLRVFSIVCNQERSAYYNTQRTFATSSMVLSSTSLR